MRLSACRHVGWILKGSTSLNVSSGLHDVTSKPANAYDGNGCTAKSVLSVFAEHSDLPGVAFRRRLLHEYVTYYHQDRIHDFLDKNAPNRRAVERKLSPVATVISNRKLGGLHHRYGWSRAA
jgi:hypothetical protein